MDVAKSLQGATQWFEGVLNVSASPTTVSWLRSGADELALVAKDGTLDAGVASQLRKVATDIHEAADKLKAGLAGNGAPVEGIEDSFAYLGYVAADASATRLGLSIDHGFELGHATARFQASSHLPTTVPDGVRDAILATN